MPDEIRVILAEDSPTVRRYLCSLIEEAPDMRVIGEARNGAEAISLVRELRPDVVSMDINMPEVNGLDATRHIMMQAPTPVVVVSGRVDHDVQLSLNALEAGALAVIGKPPDRNSPAFARKYRELITTLRAMAGVKVISRKRYSNGVHQAEWPVTKPLSQLARAHRPQPEVLAIGASTGGPSATQRLLRELAADFPLPILIAQHMPPEFIPGLAQWLASATALRVRVAENGMPLMSGCVYVAPGTAHMMIQRRSNGLAIRLVKDRGQYRYIPSVDALMQSVAQVCRDAAIGVVLTGMGDDGANGLLAMRQQGAYTLVQDQSSSTVFGMPRAAIERGAAERVEPLLNLPSKISKLV